MSEVMRYGPPREFITSVSEIYPDVYYSRVDLSHVKMARGIPLNVVLNSDPMAPKGTRSSSKVLTLGRDIIEYLSSAHDITPSMAQEMASAIVAEARSEAKRIVDLAEKEKETVLAQTRAEETARNERLFRQHVQETALQLSKCVTTDFERRCGVYLLMLNGRIVYVGQSVNVFSRIHQHVGKKKFDQVRLLPCKREDLNDLEGFLIRALMPDQNGWGENASHGAPPSRLWRGTFDLTEQFIGAEFSE